MRRPLAVGFAIAFSAASWATTVSADVVVEMPGTCPKGTTKGFDHDGSYCSPPRRADCPPGYVPQRSKS